MYQFTPRLTFVRILEKNCPAAVAWVTGKETYSELSGLVKFYETPYDGILVEAEIFGLPNISTQDSSDFYAMHIHENGDCSVPFDHTGEHYSKDDSPHPQHSGDMLPLMGNQGYAWTVFYDKRVTIQDIVGRSVVIHAMPDDFMTQPSGNSGTMIACGEIRRE